MTGRARPLSQAAGRVRHVGLIAFVKVDAIPAAWKRQVKFDTAETRIIKVEVVGADFVAEIGFSVTVVPVHLVRSLG